MSPSAAPRHPHAFGRRLPQGHLPPAPKAGAPAATSDIAHLLESRAPSVSGMVKRLSEQGLLEHVPYKGVQLTPVGRLAALRMVRRHRIIEAYLVAFLGLHLGYGARRGRAAGARRLRHPGGTDGAALGQSQRRPPRRSDSGRRWAIGELVYTPLSRGAGRRDRGDPPGGRPASAERLRYSRRRTGWCPAPW